MDSREPRQAIRCNCSLLYVIFQVDYAESVLKWIDKKRVQDKPVAEGGGGLEGGQCPPPAGNKIEIVPHQTKICSCLF